jgi:ABC-2 type transport system permease protein
MSRFVALARASARAYLRHKITLFFTFVFPLVFLVIFGLLFGGSEVNGHHVIDYLAPGVMSWAVASGALFGVAYTLVHWREADVLRLIRMTPTSVWTVLSARFLIAVVIALLQAFFFIGIASLPVFGLHLAPRALLALPGLLLGVTVFFTIGILIGTYASSPEAIAAIANCIMVPMAFLSGTFFPLDAAPGWVKSLSLALPLRYLNEGVAVMSGTAGPTSVILPCVVLVLFSAILAAPAAKLFRWSREG